MKEEKAKSVYCADAIAIKLLDYYEEGMYAYEEGENKTEKQRNLKREFKTFVDDAMTDTRKNRGVKALQETLLSLTDSDRLRTENKHLRHKVKVLTEYEKGEKELVQTLFKDEFKQEIKDNFIRETQEDLQSSRKTNQKLLRHIYELESRLDAGRNNVDKEMFDKVEKENYDLNTKLYEATKKKKKTPKELMREKLQRQMDELDSDEEVETIVETI
jgi:hypothetical protein|tara:strand:- start:2441 stop:3088 length:648 start_codon:yes stop_codon:yes gene_type:complete